MLDWDTNQRKNKGDKRTPTIANKQCKEQEATKPEKSDVEVPCKGTGSMWCYAPNHPSASATPQ
jgi:hypothetical protein